MKIDVMSSVKSMVDTLKKGLKQGGDVDHALIRSINTMLKTLLEISKADAAIKAANPTAGQTLKFGTDLDAEEAALEAQIKKVGIKE